MDSTSPIRAGVSAAATDPTPCSNTFWKWMGHTKRSKATAEFARVFRARPRYRRRVRVRESPQATGYGLAS